MLCSPRTDGQTDTHTDRQTDTKVNTEDILSGFQEFFLQPIMKDRSNNESIYLAPFQFTTLHAGELPIKHVAYSLQLVGWPAYGVTTRIRTHVTWTLTTALQKLTIID